MKIICREVGEKKLKAECWLHKTKKASHLMKGFFVLKVVHLGFPQVRFLA